MLGEVWRRVDGSMGWSEMGVDGCISVRVSWNHLRSNCNPNLMISAPTFFPLVLIFEVSSPKLLGKKRFFGLMFVNTDRI